jgi:hypothetical protein
MSKLSANAMHTTCCIGPALVLVDWFNCIQINKKLISTIALYYEPDCRSADAFSAFDWSWFCSVSSILMPHWSLLTLTVVFLLSIELAILMKVKALTGKSISWKVFIQQPAYFPPVV